jgi:Skp family chaperone for outer membrane proteins
MQVTAERKEGGSVTVDYDFGENITDLTAKFGDEVVRSHAQRSFVVALQSFMRSQLDQGKSEAEIQAAVNEWKPGQRAKGKSAAERVSELLQKMDPAARQALLKEYRAQAKAGATA